MRGQYTRRNIERDARGIGWDPVLYCAVPYSTVQCNTCGVSARRGEGNVLAVRGMEDVGRGGPSKGTAPEERRLEAHALLVTKRNHLNEGYSDTAGTP